MNMKRVFTIPERTHGSGPVFFTWQLSKGNYLVTTGYDQCVNIYDRHGEKVDQISLPGMCVGMSWDKDGDILGIINDRSPVLILWDSNNHRITQVDTGLRDPASLLLWASTSPILAIGTAKGNMLIYNHHNSRKIPILGKHSRRISFGAWSQQNYLALVGDDKIVTVSNQEGDTVCQESLKAEPSLVQFSCMKLNGKSDEEDTVSIVLNKKTLYLLNIYDTKNPIILAFQDRYGTIVDYKWFGDCNILLGFSKGFFIVISTHLQEIGQELVQVKCHKDSLSHMSTCMPHNKVASCGDNTIKLYNLSDLEEVLSIINVEEEQELEWLEWTEDGQLLGAAGSGGAVYVHLTKLPILGASFGPQYAMLTSLLEVTVANAIEQDSSNSMRVDIEPGFLGLGPFHLAIGMNNRAWFYGIGGKVTVPLRDREYLGTIQSLKLNSDYAAALYEGKIQLHMIEGEYGESEEKESRLFPDGDFSHIRIACHSMTTDFLIYGTNTGSVNFFLLEDWQLVNEYKHPVGIRKLYPDSSGTRVIIIDDKFEGFVYNPVNDFLTPILSIPNAIKGCLWDAWPLDKDVFLLYDENQIYIFVYARDTIEGTKTDLVGTSKLVIGQHPLLLYNGELICQTQSGKTASLTLSTHQIGDKSKDHSQTELKEALQKTIKLHRFRESWGICQLLNNKEDWEMLGKAAIYHLEIELAIRIFQHIGDVGMVWSLQSVKGTEDRQLLAGHLAMFNNMFNLAQELYLSSNYPMAALEMRRDLLHWDQALQLAKKLSPEQIPEISKEYAQQLEFVGDYVNALSHYEKGLIEGKGSERNATCTAGIARMSIRCGNLRKGLQLARESQSRTLKKECAEILESMKQFAEAAELYENGSYHDKAAMLLIKLKNWKKVSELLPNITTSKIHFEYAKSRESEGHYKEAAKAYEMAREYDNVIRLQLEHLNNPEEAVRLVKEHKSIDGAKMIARFFQRLNDMTSAIQFLVLSNCNNEAFQLAQSAGKMDIYADVIGEEKGSREDYLSVAMYYEKEKNNFKAGKFYYLGGQFKKAVKYLLRCSTNTEDEQSMQLAIKAVGASQDDQLTRQVIEYLMGELDGVPKDFKYLFRLYMALKQFREAAKTAIIIAREEQNAGNYRNAHDVLFSMYQELKKQAIKIPSEMYANLMILHSYVLVKIHVRKGDHLKAARMLIRVANNISKFPSHIVPILTSTVIECHRANLRKSSFSYAAMLMRPEYRSQIDLKYKKKIEAIVRKPQKIEEEEEMTPCPFCNNLLPLSELTCLECRNNIPFCIVTGWHIVKEGMTTCPSCSFPGIRQEFAALLSTEENCPMCLQKINPEILTALEDIKIYLFPEGDD